MIGSFARTVGLYKLSLTRPVIPALEYGRVHLEKDAHKKKFNSGHLSLIGPLMRAMYDNSHHERLALEAEQKLKPMRLRNQLKDRVRQKQYEANFPVEDYMRSSQLSEIEGYLLAVFDGHGGPELVAIVLIQAQFSSYNITQYFESSLRKIKNEASKSSDALELALQETYTRLEAGSLELIKDNVKKGNRKLKNSGTCALTIVVSDNTLYVANVGDSKGILICESEENKKCVKLNRKFNASSKQEQIRLRTEFPTEEDIIMPHPANPDAMYVKGRLQCTRTIGDFYLKLPEFSSNLDLKKFNGPYITAKPDIRKFELDPSSKYLVIASDGLWDEINKHEVTKLILNCQEEDKAQMLINKCLQRIAVRNQTTIDRIQQLKEKEKRSYHDDISVMVVDLQGQFNPSFSS